VSSRFDDDVQFNGQVRFAKAPTLPTAAAVGNNQMSPADPAQPDKLYHRFRRAWGQPHGTAATAERRALYVAGADGTLTDFRVGVVAAAVGDSTVTLDLRKNGTSVLSSAVTLTSSAAAYAKTTAAVATPGYVAGDVFELVQTVSAGTGTLPQGAFAVAAFDERPA
jgi:hypothetical protein